jgi:hypothetical protein
LPNFGGWENHFGSMGGEKLKETKEQKMMNDE